MKRKLWLMGLLVTALAAFLMVLAACAAEATPTPTPKPPTPTPTPRPPTPTPTPLPPGVTPTPTPTPVPKTPEQVTYEVAMEEFKLVEAAGRKEGLVFLYTNMNSELMIARKAGFEKRYPEIRLDGMYIGGSTPTLERIRAETLLRKRVADGTTTSVINATIMITEGHTVYYVPPATLEPGVPWLRDLWVEGAEHRVLVPQNRNRFWLVNTKLLPPEQRPKSWLELADPKWRGKIAINDPSVPVGGGMIVTFSLKEIYGEEYIKALFANIIIMDGTPGVRATAAGEYMIYLDADYPGYLTVKEAPVELVMPEEGALAYLSELPIIFKDAPHPNAIKVYVNWQVTKEGSEAAASVGNTPNRLDVESLSPLLSPTVKRLPGTPRGVDFAVKDRPVWGAWALAELKKLGKK